MNNDTSESPVIQVTLTNGYATTIDQVDIDLFDTPWQATVKDGKPTYVICCNVKFGKAILHRIILQRKIGRPLEKGETCDHRDGNGLNNTRSNLRVATNAQNSQNKSIYKRNKSGYKGVTWNSEGKKWVARIGFNGKYIYLGIFADIKDAARCYNEAALKYHGEFARLNVIED